MLFTVSVAVVGYGLKKSRKMGRIPHCWLRDSRGSMVSEIVPVIANWINWKVTYWISLIPWLKAIKLLSEYVEMDFVWISLWRVSRPVGLRNQLGLVSATVNLNWVCFPSLVACAICRCQIRTISRSWVLRRVSGWLASQVGTRSYLLPLTSIW
jgi:hypothetical protein